MPVGVATKMRLYLFFLLLAILIIVAEVEGRNVCVFHILKMYIAKMQFEFRIGINTTIQLFFVTFCFCLVQQNRRIYILVTFIFRKEK